MARNVGGLSAARSTRSLDADAARGPLSTRPAAVLVGVLALWTLVPALALPTKVRWALTAAVIAVVLNAVYHHVDRVRWTAPVTLISVLYLSSTLSVLHHGTPPDMIDGLLTGVLLVGVLLLATTCGRADVLFVARGIIVLGLAELLVALLEAFAGVAAPWGYLGSGQSVVGTNPLLPFIDGRSMGTMAHALPFGTLMATAAVLAMFTRWTRWWQWRLLTVVALSFGVLLSGSRSAVLAAVLAIALGVFLPGRRHAVLVRFAAVVTTAIILFTVDLSELPIFTSLEGTGSLEHRLGALEAAGRLVDRPILEMLFGSGAGSLSELFASGFLQVDGFFAVDNQLVQTFAVAGLVGLLCLLGVVVLGLARGDRSTRPAALCVFAMFFSFDILAWQSTALLFVVLAGLGSAPPSSAPVVRPVVRARPRIDRGPFEADPAREETSPA
jgi:hypothetical protein